MTKSILILAIAVAFVAGTLVSGTMAYAQQPKGTPFDALWNAIANLQTQINNISITPGPQGEQGEPGPQGEQGEPGPQGEQGPSGITSLHDTQGTVLLTQPEFSVAGFNQVIAYVSINPPTSPAFELFPLVSIHTKNPTDGTVYHGEVDHRLIARHSSTSETTYELQFFLLTTPLPPNPDGSPAPGDTAPAGSTVEVEYRVVFVELQ